MQLPARCLTRRAPGTRIQTILASGWLQFGFWLSNYATTPSEDFKGGTNPLLRSMKYHYFHRLVAGGRSTSCRGGKGGGARRKDGGKAGREGGGEKRRERAERQEGAEMAKVTTSNPRLSDSDCLGWCLSPEVAGARRSPKRCPVPRFVLGRATSANGHGSMQPFS